ncbi:hypothetical protein KSP40_PGU011475 [Platanthera guangdongensis]|uniref:Uncharacterized protein n=1 Tax=Platanthera guangdongensis TaxID=2320717 RepID=A0ABR2N434_9ASPA
MNRDNGGNKGLLWRLPVVKSKEIGKLGPGIGFGAGCGVGLGVGLFGDWYTSDIDDHHLLL